MAPSSLLKDQILRKPPPSPRVELSKPLGPSNVPGVQCELVLARFCLGHRPAESISLREIQSARCGVQHRCSRTAGLSLYSRCGEELPGNLMPGPSVPLPRGLDLLSRFWSQFFLLLGVKVFSATLNKFVFSRCSRGLSLDYIAVIVRIDGQNEHECIEATCIHFSKED